MLSYGDTVTVYEDKVAPPRAGDRVRVNVSAWMLAPTGNHVTFARDIERRLSRTLFGDVYSEPFTPKIGGTLVPEDADGRERRGVSLTIDGRLAEGWTDVPELKSRIAYVANTDFDFDDFRYEVTAQDVYLGDLGRVALAETYIGAPVDKEYDHGQLVDHPTLNDAIEESAREVGGAAGGAAGSFGKGLFGGAVSGLWSGLGWLGWVLLALVLVLVAVAVWALVKHPAAVATVAA